VTPPEAAMLLTAICANDGREVTEAAAHAWAEALPDVSLADARSVLPSYYRNARSSTRNWIYPGDVLGLVVAYHRGLRGTAFQAAMSSAVEEGLDDDEARARAITASRNAVPGPILQVEAPKPEGTPW
jgi:hypothetical protein